LLVNYAMIILDILESFIFFGQCKEPTGAAEHSRRSINFDGVELEKQEFYLANKSHASI